MNTHKFTQALLDSIKRDKVEVKNAADAAKYLGQTIRKMNNKKLKEVYDSLHADKAKQIYKDYKPQIKTALAGLFMLLMVRFYYNKNKKEEPEKKSSTKSKSSTKTKSKSKTKSRSKSKSKSKPKTRKSI